MDHVGAKSATARINEVEFESLDLPIPTKNLLRSEGIPVDLRLRGWAGPTLFTAEIREGRVGVRGSDYVIGSVRETLDAHDAYSFFCLRRGSGDLYLALTNQPKSDRFVNSSLQSFMTSLRFFAQAWEDTRDFHATNIDNLIAGLRDLLHRVDPPALSNPNNY
jgi:hypothetical protein